MAERADPNNAKDGEQERITARSSLPDGAPPSVSSTEDTLAADSEMQPGDVESLPPAPPLPTISDDAPTSNGAAGTPGTQPVYCTALPPAPRAPMLNPSFVSLDVDVEDFHLPPPAMPLLPEFPMSSYPSIYYVEGGEAGAPSEALPNPEAGVHANADTTGSEDTLPDASQEHEGLDTQETVTRGVVWALFAAPSFFDLNTSVILTTRYR